MEVEVQVVTLPLSKLEQIIEQASERGIQRGIEAAFTHGEPLYSKIEIRPVLEERTGRKWGRDAVDNFIIDNELVYKKKRGNTKLYTVSQFLYA